MTPEEFGIEMKSMLKDSEGKMTEAIEAKVKAFSEANDVKFNELVESVKAQGEELRKMRENEKTGEKFECLKDAISKQLKDRFAGKSLDEIKNSLKNEKLTIEVKAAGNMTIAGNATGTVQRRGAVVWDIAPKRTPFIRDFATVSTTSNAILPIMSKVNEDGDAGWTGEGAVKPLRDFDLVVAEKSAKKVSEVATFSNEIMQDVDMFLEMLTIDLIEQVNLKEEDGILFGTGSGNDPVGVTTVASAYVLTSIETTDPNDMDAIRAAYAQVVSLNHTPTAVFVNPIDAANMDLVKTSEGMYVLPPFTTAEGMVIKGVQVVEKNQIPVGYFLIGDMRKVMIFDYIAMTIELGYNGEDWKYNRITARCEKRLHAYVSSNNENAFVYEAFSTVKSAITAVQA